MLSQQDAQDRLTEFRFKGTVADRFSGEISRLPKGLRGIARDVFREKYDDPEAQAAALQSLSEAELRELIETTFPLVSAALLKAWDHFQGLPATESGEFLFRSSYDLRSARQRQSHWFLSLVDVAAKLQPEAMTPEWLSIWPPYLGDDSSIFSLVVGYLPFGHRRQDVIGRLLAGAIDTDTASSENVFDTLRIIAKGRHPISTLSGHVLLGFARCHRDQAWDLLMDLLEQAKDDMLAEHIMSACAEGSLNKIIQMLETLRTNEPLLKKAGVRVALARWAGVDAVGFNQAGAAEWLDFVLPLLTNPADLAIALESKDKTQLRMGLWAQAVIEVGDTVSVADMLLDQRDEDCRVMITQLLGSFQSPLCLRLWSKLLGDSLPVAIRSVLWAQTNTDSMNEGEIVTALLRLYERTKKTPAKNCRVGTFDRGKIQARIINVLCDYWGDRDITPLLGFKKEHPGIEKLDDTIAASPHLTAAQRKTILELCQPEGTHPHRLFAVVIRHSESTDELVEVAKWLLQSEKHFLRMIFVEATLKLSDDRLVDFIKSALMLGRQNQRALGLQLLEICLKKRRAIDDSSRLLLDFFERPKLTKAEREKVKRLRSHLPTKYVEQGLDQTAASTASSQRDTVGSLHPGSPERAGTAIPTRTDTLVETPAVKACLRSLDEYVARNAERMLIHLGCHEEGDALKQLERHASAWHLDHVLRDEIVHWPVEVFWDEWNTSRDATTCDSDGRELARAYLLHRGHIGELPNWEPNATEANERLAKHWSATERKPLKTQRKITDFALAYLVAAMRPRDVAELCVGALEDYLSIFVPVLDQATSTELQRNTFGSFDFRDVRPWRVLNKQLGDLFCRVSSDVPSEVWARWWSLLQWSKHPTPKAFKWHPNTEWAQAAYQAGIADEHELWDIVQSERYPHAEGLLESLSRAAPERFDAWMKFLHALGEEIVAAEVARTSSNPTAYSEQVLTTGFLPGLDLLVPVMKKAGKAGFKRATGNVNDARVVLSHLVAIIYPTDTDTPDRFAAEVKPLIQSGQISEQTAIQVGFLAPQWAEHVEAALGLAGYTDTVIWWRQHLDYGMEQRVLMKQLREPDAVWQQEHEFATIQSEPDEKHLDRWIDLPWIRAHHLRIGPKRWAELEVAFKPLTKPNEFQRVCDIVRAIYDKLNVQDQIELVKEGKPKADVRLLGILSLPRPDQQPANDLAQRLSAIETYRRVAQTMDSGEARHILLESEVAKQLLAQQLELTNVGRIDWHALGSFSMAVAALRTISVRDAKIETRFGPAGNLELVVLQQGKVRKSIPAALKKNEQVAKLVELRKQIKRQATLVRASLSSALRMDEEISVSELRNYLEQDGLAAMLCSLAYISSDGFMGYLTQGAKSLEHPSSQTRKLKSSEGLRLVHPYDLYQAGEWKLWRDEFANSRREQAVRQVQRELFVPRTTELEANSVAERFADRFIHQFQATNILESMGWSIGQYEATINYVGVGINASVHVDWASDAGSRFVDLQFIIAENSAGSEDGSLPFDRVPARIFSETLRDLHQVMQAAEVEVSADERVSEDKIQRRQKLAERMLLAGYLPNTFRTGCKLHIAGQFSDYSVDLVTAKIVMPDGRHLWLEPFEIDSTNALLEKLQQHDPAGYRLLCECELLANDYELENPAIRDKILGR